MQSHDDPTTTTAPRGKTSTDGGAESMTPAQSSAAAYAARADAIMAIGDRLNIASNRLVRLSQAFPGGHEAGGQIGSLATELAGMADEVRGISEPPSTGEEPPAAVPPSDEPSRRGRAAANQVRRERRDILAERHALCATTDGSMYPVEKRAERSVGDLLLLTSYCGEHDPTPLNFAELSLEALAEDLQTLGDAIRGTRDGGVAERVTFPATIDRLSTRALCAAELSRRLVDAATTFGDVDVAHRTATDRSEPWRI